MCIIYICKIFFDATTNEIKLYLYRYVNTDLVVSILASLNIMVVNVTVFKGLKVSPHKSCSASPAPRRSYSVFLGKQIFLMQILFSVTNKMGLLNKLVARQQYLYYHANLFKLEF